MPLNATEREKVQTAVNELAKKVKLEARMQTELRELFKIISVDFAALYSQTGAVPNAQTYAPDVRGIVSRQYRRVATAFTGSIVVFLREASKAEKEQIIKDLKLIADARLVTLDELIDELENNTTLKIGQFTAQRTDFDTASITRTTQKQLDKSVTKTRNILRDDLGREPTRQEIAAKASKDFRESSFNRVGTIAATTTQGAAEGIKQIEREEFLNVRNSFESVELGLGQIEPKDTWITQGDSFVRTSPFNHLAADFQERENGVFNVSGQQLKFPGDRSLGASAGNTINCRCSAVTVIE